MNANVLNSLQPIREQLFFEIEQEQRLLDSAVARAVACKHTKRHHAVVTRHLHMALALTETEQLKQLKMSSAGGFFVDALRTLVDEEQEVRELHSRLKRLELRTALFRLISPADDDRAFEQGQARLRKALEDQFLPEHRETCVEQLRNFLQDNDGEIAAAREALAEYLIQFLKEKYKLAITLAGDRTIPSWGRMLPADLLRRAEEALAVDESKLSDALQQKLIASGVYRVAWLQANRALSMLLIAHPLIAEKISVHLPDGSVGGLLSFVQQCLPALEQQPSNGTSDAVQYRIGVSHDGVTKVCSDYSQMFANDLSRLEEHLERFNTLLRLTVERLEQLSSCHKY